MGTTVTLTHEQRVREERLVRDNLPLVQYAVNEVAHRVPRQVHRDDLVSAGMLGLTQAARSFEEERGIPFDRYASRRIHGALLDELRSRDWASRSVRAKAREVRQVTEEMTTKLGRTPTSDELGDELDVEPASVQELQADVHRATVLNYESLAFDGPAEGLLASGEESPEQTMISRERQAFLTDAVASLPARLRKVVVEYFFDERPMQDIAHDLGVSESRVSQLRAEALSMLRDGMNANLDPERLSPERRPDGKIARRKRTYYNRVAAQTDPLERVSAEPRDVHEKVALAG